MASHVSPMHESSVMHVIRGRNPYSCVMSDASRPPTFAELIVEGRRQRGWSQDELEAESGVSRSTLSRWERGLADKPEPAHVRAVCAALGLDPRRAAVALGYLTQEEVDGDHPRLDPNIEEVLAILQDPAVPGAEKESWIDYLKFLQAKARNRAG